ncbi:MAG TPA: helix-turn-helix domain-containing protein [Bacteroidia bacterium]|nr:helix-turn-helix domain-containing protein [Bacteroidia bacterium]
MAKGSYANDTLLIDFYRLPYLVRTVAGDSTGEIWISGGKGLQVLRKNGFFTIQPDFIGDIVTYQGKIIQLDNHPIYKGHYPSGYNNTWSKYISSANNLYTNATDKVGKIWVCNGRELFIFKVDSTFSKTLSGKSVRGLCFNKGILYANTYSGIYKNEDRIIDEIQMADGGIVKVNQMLYFLYGGIAAYDPQSDSSAIFPSPELAHPVDSLFKSAFFRDGVVFNDTVWLASTNGLAYWNTDHAVFIGPRIFVENVAVENGKLWVLSRYDGVYIKSGGELIKQRLPEGIEYNDVTFVANNNTYYFATNQGVLCSSGDSLHFLTRLNGLSNNEVYSVIIGADGNIWSSTYAGLNRINPRTGKIQNFLTNVEFNLRSFCSGNDELFFGGTNGVYEIKPLAIAEPAEQHAESNYIIILSVVLGLSIIVILMESRYRKKKAKKLDQILDLDKKELFLKKMENLVMDDIQSSTVDSLATKMGMSSRSLYRMFDDFGIKPGEFLRSMRMRKANHLISLGINDLTAIAAATGYSKEYLKKALLRPVHTDKHSAGE